MNATRWLTLTDYSKRTRPRRRRQAVAVSLPPVKRPRPAVLPSPERVARTRSCASASSAPSSFRLQRPRRRVAPPRAHRRSSKSPRLPSSRQRRRPLVVVKEDLSRRNLESKFNFIHLFNDKTISNSVLQIQKKHDGLFSMFSL